MKLKKYLFLGVLLGCSSLKLKAQEGNRVRLPYKSPEGQVVWQLEGQISGFVAQPRGDFARLSPSSSNFGNALRGWGSEFRLSQRMVRAPQYFAQIHLAYQQHPMNSQGVLAQFGEAQRFEAKPWQLGHFMGGLAFQAGRYLKLEAHAAAGLWFYQGWQALSETLILGTDQVMRSVWDTKAQIALGWRMGLQLGYALPSPSRRLTLFAQFSFLRGQGGRRAKLSEEILDNQGGVIQGPDYFNVLHRSYLASTNIGLGLRYQFYKRLQHPSMNKQGVRD